MNLSTKVQNRYQRQFLRSWVSNPLQIAAIAPSGKHLAQIMTREISPSTGRVLELGPGIGSFTQQILENGLCESNLTLIEIDSSFAALLRQHFPNANVLCTDATRLYRNQLPHNEKVDLVISGLGLLSMPYRKVFSILLGSFSHLSEKGALYQFTYGLRCPIPRSILDRLGLKASYIGCTLKNLPPASVYRIVRRPTLRTQLYLDIYQK